MSTRRSAGLLMYRQTADTLEVLLAHPGGPKHADRDAGVWSIPKGEFEPGETPLATAQREFEEETGLKVPSTEFTNLGTIQQKGGKIVYAWAFCGEGIDTSQTFSNRITIEWPPKSGQQIEIPEVDRAEYFPLSVARTKIKERQIPFLDRLKAALAH